ncbi:MAG: hypothetical protein WBN76_12365 [Azonexus sp.]
MIIEMGVIMMLAGITEAGSLRGFVPLDQRRLTLADAPANAKKPRHQALPGQEEKLRAVSGRAAALGEWF